MSDPLAGSCVLLCRTIVQIELVRFKAFHKTICYAISSSNNDIKIAELIKKLIEDNGACKHRHRDNLV